MIFQDSKTMAINSIIIIDSESDVSKEPLIFSGTQITKLDTDFSLTEDRKDKIETILHPFAYYLCLGNTYLFHVGGNASYGTNTQDNEAYNYFVVNPENKSLWHIPGTIVSLNYTNTLAQLSVQNTDSTGMHHFQIQGHFNEINLKCPTMGYIAQCQPTTNATSSAKYDKLLQEYHNLFDPIVPAESHT